jgi:hypothetical protein
VTTALWAAVLALAALWPSRLSGALDGAPLDSIAEVVLIGVVLPFTIWLAPGVLRLRLTRLAIVALLAWKAFTTATLVQDGWCLRFTSPVAIFVDDLRVPHAWDVRADWRSNPPRCSAVMTRGYHALNEFPAWFYNLPPDNFKEPSHLTEQPPFVMPAIHLDGGLSVAREGNLAIAPGDGVAIQTTIDGRLLDGSELRDGVRVGPGNHRVEIDGTLSGANWSLVPTWNGSDLFAENMTTVVMPGPFDGWLRPWGRYVTPLLLLLVVAVAVAEIASRTRQALAIIWTVSAASVLAIVGALAPVPAVRTAPLFLAVVVALPLRRHLRNAWGAILLVGVPFMALVTAFHARDAGVFTWYSVGDDFWMYQRYAYRIYMQGYWLEGGQPTFWFQPLYRWIAGALHMIFGDSSIGEALWDGACILAGALLTFAITRAVAGFRWAISAMIVVLVVLMLGPIWYLIGRGLAELSSMGLLAAAALLALQGRGGSWRLIAMSGICATLAFYTRLNNLPMMLAMVAFAWPLRQQAGDLWSPSRLLRPMSARVLFGVAIAIAIGLLLFAARTWHYTGVFSLLYGTQAAARSVWQTTDEGITPLQNLVGSFLMVVTMADPPRLDPRGIPIALGLLSAILAVARIRPFDRLPLNAVLLCIAGFVGALVARGSAYPGRFSAHVIPVATALAVSAIALLVRRMRKELP